MRRQGFDYGDRLIHLALDVDEVRGKALEEVRAEQFRIEVEKEKLRLLAKRSVWDRLTACLPFTITVTRKTK
jgi:hypothetical protein